MRPDYTHKNHNPGDVDAHDRRGHQGQHGFGEGQNRNHYNRYDNHDFAGREGFGNRAQLERARMHATLKLLSGTVVFLLITTLSLLVGHGLSTLIFSLTGTPSDILKLIISGFLGFSVLLLSIRIFLAIHNSVHKEKPFGLSGRKYSQDVIEAMNRIAQGDFSVLLPIEKHDPMSPIAESVNKMARELGTMENLRQDFVSNVSHEIQSPLTSITGFAELLKNEDLEPEKRQHYLEVIETEAKRLSKLSDNLLKLSQLESEAESLAISKFSLDKQLQNDVLMLEPQWSEKQIEISLELAEVDISGDEDLLAQVWINLLQNAIKFTPEQGRISVALGVEGEKAVCVVSDNGIGISEEDRVHIFERFYKADKSRERSLGGNGLGLSLARKIVELHSGIIFVQSVPQVGSTFTVELPLTPPEQPPLSKE